MSDRGQSPGWLQGRRVPDDEWFEWQAEGRIEPGDYGCQEIGGVVQWFTCNPDGAIGYLAVHEPDKAGNHHVITEHDDGTISVGGSIKTPDGSYAVFPGDQIHGAGPISSPGGWHGWLEFGRWRPVGTPPPEGEKPPGLSQTDAPEA